MRVLIAYDGSEASKAVFDDLKNAGLPGDCEVVVASVGDLLMNSPSLQESVVEAVASRRVAPGIERAQSHAEKVLAEAEEFAAYGKDRVKTEFPGWHVRSEVFTGSPAWVLIDVAEKLRANLIIVGSHGRSAISRLFLGSVSKRIATDARCSVRIVRGRVETDAAPASSAPRLVLGVDGSLDAESAIFTVGTRVWPGGTEVRLIAVDDITPPSMISSRLPQAAAMINEYRRNRTTRVSEMLEWATEQLGHLGLKTTVLRENGDPTTIILEEAIRWRADSIFVGTRDLKNAFQRLRLGSVSTAIVNKAPCTVEIVRPPEEEQYAHEQKP